MSTVDRPAALPPLRPGERLDAAAFHARYAAMPEDTRAELVDGVVILMSPLHDGHGELDRNLGGWLFLYKRGTPGTKSPANVSTRLDPRNEVQPDAQLRIEEAHGGRSRVVDGVVTGPPELVVEVGRSSRDHDLGRKKALYERSGVLEYLFVGVEPAEVAWFALRGGRYEPIEPEADGTLRSMIFPGLRLDPGALFGDDLDRLVDALERGMGTPEHAAFVRHLGTAGDRS